MSKFKCTEAQGSVIQHIQGPLLVTAGPGSGKTTVLTHRLVHLVRDQGIDPEKILVITLTRAAAEEMRQRFFALMEGQQCPVHIHTFHAAFLKTLRQEGLRGKILTEKEELQIICTFLSEEEGYSSTEASFLAPRILHGISAFRNTGSYRCAEEETDLFTKAGTYYEEAKKLAGKIDFDDMLIRMLEKLKEDSAFCARIRDRFDYILVDEAQDCNFIQYEIVHMLCERSRNLMLVGDDDQSIYGFRGSSPACMLQFTKDFPEIKRIDLAINFRSRPQIVMASRKLIEHNTERFKKDLVSARDGRAEIRTEAFPSARKQAGFLCREILAWHRQIPYREMAVLCRTRRQFGVLERVFRTARIPYTAEDTEPWISDMEKDLQAYLTYSIDPQNTECLYRIWNRPRRGIREAYRVREGTPTAIEAVLEQHPQDPDLRLALEELAFHCDRIRTMSPAQALKYIWHRMGYRTYRRDIQEQEWMDWKTVQDAFAAILKEATCYTTIESYLERTPVQKQDTVRLMTLHGAKGLEFDAVWIPDMNEGTLPFEKSMHMIEEERRLFYVGLTRARRYVSLLYIHSGAAGSKPSRFLQEI